MRKIKNYILYSFHDSFNKDTFKSGFLKIDCHGGYN